MKNYLITIEIRDGEYEYWERWIFQCTEETADLEILKSFTGGDDEDWTEVHNGWYENVNGYRHYQVRSCQEVIPEDLKVLRKYGI